MKAGAALAVTCALAFGGQRAEGESRTHKIERGDTLSRIAVRYYGVDLFRDLIAKHNRIETKTTLIAGETIDVPDVTTMLKDEGIPPAMLPAFNEIRLVEEQQLPLLFTGLADARRKQGAKGQKVVPLPADLAQGFREQERRLKNAELTLRATLPPGAMLPTATIQNLVELERMLERFANGRYAPRTLDRRAADAAFVQVYLTAIAWVLDTLKKSQSTP